MINIRYHSLFNDPSAELVVDRDWDNLLILDGCRYDVFQEAVDVDGELEPFSSPATRTLDFIRANFFENTFHDTIYVTASPFVSEIPESTFFRVLNLLQSEWDPSLETVPPGPVTDAAISALKQYPNKRLIVHYMQPHYPFIGNLGQKLDQKGFGENKSEDEMDVWTQLRYRFVKKDLVQRAYEENLDIVLEEAQRFLDSVNGKTVVTSDHGNLIGDRLTPLPTRGYGHPGGLYVDELVTVPWLEAPHNSRRDVQADEPISIAYDDMRDLNEKLAALGYT